MHPVDHQVVARRRREHAGRGAATARAVTTARPAPTLGLRARFGARPVARGERPRTPARPAPTLPNHDLSNHGLPNHGHGRAA